MDGQDEKLPIANVGRMMKQILPPNAKIAKEAKETMQECATEFISFVTSEASNKCLKENRKTMNGDDICWALRALGFDDLGDATFKYLHKCRDLIERQKSASSSINKNNKSNLLEPTTQDTYDGKQNEVLTTLELGGRMGNY